MKTKVNWNQRVIDCRRRAATIYPEFLRARKAYERLDRCHTYWANRALEAELKTIKEEKGITLVPKDETKDSMEKAKEKFHKAFGQMSAEQQEQTLKELLA